MTNIEIGLFGDEVWVYPLCLAFVCTVASISFSFLPPQFGWLSSRRLSIFSSSILCTLLCMIGFFSMNKVWIRCAIATEVMFDFVDLLFVSYLSPKHIGQAFVHHIVSIITIISSTGSLAHHAYFGIICMSVSFSGCLYTWMLDAQKKQKTEGIANINVNPGLQTIVLEKRQKEFFLITRCQFAFFRLLIAAPCALIIWFNFPAASVFSSNNEGHFRLSLLYIIQNGDIRMVFQMIYEVFAFGLTILFATYVTDFDFYSLNNNTETKFDRQHLKELKFALSRHEEKQKTQKFR